MSDLTTDSAAMEARAKVSEAQCNQAIQLLSGLADWVRDQQMRADADEYPAELIAAEKWLTRPGVYHLGSLR